ATVPLYLNIRQMPGDFTEAAMRSGHRDEALAASDANATRSTLTPQELQIVQMVTQGLTNGAIAQRLYPSRRTAESHLYRVYPKLGVSSRAQLGDLQRPGLPAAAGAGTPSLTAAPSVPQPYCMDAALI